MKRLVFPVLLIVALVLGGCKGGSQPEAGNTFKGPLLM